jgi:hypothetical protein
LKRRPPRLAYGPALSSGPVKQVVGDFHHEQRTMCRPLVRIDEDTAAYTMIEGISRMWS